MQSYFKYAHFLIGRGIHKRIVRTWNIRLLDRAIKADVNSRRFLLSGIMTLTSSPCELDNMSLFQNLKLKRGKVDSRCSSDGKNNLTLYRIYRISIQNEMSDVTGFIAPCIRPVRYPSRIHHAAVIAIIYLVRHTACHFILSG